MPADAPPPAQQRWRDVDGTPISLFCEVEQVADGAEPALLGSRLHQRGHVVGRGLASLYVCFPNNQMISVRPHLLRVLDDAAGCSQVQGLDRDRGGGELDGDHPGHTAGLGGRGRNGGRNRRARHPYHPPGTLDRDDVMPVAGTDWTVGQTSHRLISEALGDELRQAVQAGPSVADQADSIRYRVSAVLYLLLREHSIDRRGRCRSCRRPGAMMSIRRQPCRILIKARYWLLRPPEEAQLLSLLAAELPASPPIVAQREPSAPADPLWP